MLGENKLRALEASVVVRHVFSCPGSHHSHMVSVAATTLPQTMDAAVPTTPPSDSSSFDYSDDGRRDAAEQVLTNATLLKTTRSSESGWWPSAWRTLPLRGTPTKQCRAPWILLCSNVPPHDRDPRLSTPTHAHREVGLSFA